MSHAAQPLEETEIEIEIAKFWKSSRGRDEAIVVAIKEYKGHKFLDCRIFFTNAAGQLCPTSKGITIGPRRVAEFAKAIQKAQAKIVELGLLEGADA